MCKCKGIHEHDFCYRERKIKREKGGIGERENIKSIKQSARMYMRSIQSHWFWLNNPIIRTNEIESVFKKTVDKLELAQNTNDLN